MELFVITDVEGGWDNVRGVYSTKELAIEYCAERDGVSPSDWEEGNSKYVIHDTYLRG